MNGLRRPVTAPAPRPVRAARRGSHADEDKEKLKDLPLYRPPNFNEEDMSDKPGWMRLKPQLTDEEIAALDEFRRNQILTLLSLDRAIEKVMGTLTETVLIFLAD